MGTINVTNPEEDEPEAKAGFYVIMRKEVVPLYDNQGTT